MNSSKTRSGWRGVLAAVPAVGLSLLPNVTCPACWPAYAGLLSSLGVPMLINNTVLIPLTVLFMAMTVGLMAYRARCRRGYGPLAVGVIAAVMVIVGKFIFAINGIVYGGILLLVVASCWNSRPTRKYPLGSCSRCEVPGELMEISVAGKKLDAKP